MMLEETHGEDGDGCSEMNALTEANIKFQKRWEHKHKLICERHGCALWCCRLAE